MASLLTLEQLLKNRKDKLQAVCLKQANAATSTVQGSMSDESDHTVTVNTPPAPAILSIVSWNVQTFEAGKSLSSPFANVIISRILEDLAVDVCVLLETRAESYVNMNAIEGKHVGQGGWKAVADEAELDADSDEDEESEDEDDVADAAQYDVPDDNSMDVSYSTPLDDVDDQDTSPDDGTPAPDGGEPLRYLQLVSEMTGKRWMPPTRIYVYHPRWVERAKLGRDYAAFCELWTKLREVTAKDSDDVASCLASASRAAKKLDGKKAIMKFVADHKGAYKGRKKFSEKNAGAILRMYVAYAADPKRFDPVKTATDAEKNFCTAYSAFPKWLTRWAVEGKVATGLWKQKLLSEDCTLIRLYYEGFYLDDNFNEVQQKNWDDLKKLATDDSWRYVLRIKRCPGCKQPLGTGACDQVIHGTLTCQEMGPLLPSLNNLRGCINEITFYRGSAQESYSLLVRQSTTIFAPSQDGVWLNGKRAQMSWFQAGLLMHAPASQADSINQKSGNVLGYQDGKTKFYGRCPYKAPIDVWLFDAQEKTRLALVTFHGPYGADTIEGVQARAASMDELMKADVGAGVALADTEHALVMGDFNLDWQGVQANGKKQQAAEQLYQRFKGQGFEPLVDACTATSLKSIYDKAAAWRKIPPSSTSNFTSSAYDNMFLKGQVLHEQTANAAVIDVIAWIEAHIDEFKLGPEHEPPANFDSLPAKNRAFYIYHKYVSDHLPIIYDLVVQGMPDDSKAAQDAKRLLQTLKEEAARRQNFKFDYVMSYEALLDIEPAPDEAHDYTKKAEGQALRGVIVGDIDTHLEKRLMIRSEPINGQVIWLCVQLTRNGKPAQGLFLKRFLELHPTGMRVRVEVLNPVPLK